MAHCHTVTPALWGSACALKFGESASEWPEMRHLTFWPHRHFGKIPHSLPGIMVHSTEIVTRKESVLKQMSSLSLKIVLLCHEGRRRFKLEQHCKTGHHDGYHTHEFDEDVE